MDILRMESGDLLGTRYFTRGDQYQAGLNFAISYKKPLILLERNNV